MSSYKRALTFSLTVSTIILTNSISFFLFHAFFFLSIKRSIKEIIPANPTEPKTKPAIMLFDDPSSSSSLL